MINGINDDRAVRYEVAQEIISSVMAMKTEALADERAKKRPDQKAIDALLAERQALAIERRTLSSDNEQAIAHVFQDYAPIAKMAHAA